MKLNVLFKCAEFGSVMTEVQLLLKVNAKAKLKTHILYGVMRGDFSTADVDSQTPTMTRMALAVALAPDMRTLQQEAARELNTGAMTTALALSYFDLITTVLVGLEYLENGGATQVRHGYVTFGMLAFSLVTQAGGTWSMGQGTMATAITLCGGNSKKRHGFNF